MKRHTESIEVDDLFEDAEKLYAAGDMQEAEKLLKQVIQVNPYFSYAYQMQAQIRGSAGKYTDAIRTLEQCIQFDPGFAHAYYLMAKFSFRSGKFDDAVKKIEIAVRTAPSTRLYKTVKAQLIFQKNNTES